MSDLLYWLLKDPNKVLKFTPCDSLDLESGEYQYLCKTHHPVGIIRYWYLHKDGNIYVKYHYHNVPEQEYSSSVTLK